MIPIDKDFAIEVLLKNSDNCHRNFLKGWRRTGLYKDEVKGEEKSKHLLTRSD